VTAVVAQPVPALDETPVRTVAQLLGAGLSAGVVVAVTALAYRWYARTRMPLRLGLLLALSVVALVLNTVGVFTELLSGDTGLFSPARIVFNVLALAGGAAAAPLGLRAGDRVATDVFAVAGVRELDVGVSRLVRSVGRITDVTLPEEADDIEDIEGYDPVAEETKAALAGRTFIFPRRLTVADLQARLATRLRDDYGVGHVDVDLNADGEVTYLGLGSRVTGIGPTLAPGTVAVAVRADPANAASPGDVVQVWRTAPDVERLLTAELRAHVDDVATLAVNEEDATKLDATTTYRLVTLPAEPRADREFASLLRAADETMYVVTVDAGSDLDGTAVGDLEATVAAVEHDGSIEALARDRTLAAGDAVYVIGRPETYRRIDARARASPETQSS
jgi:hypothetical protein